MNQLYAKQLLNLLGSFWSRLFGNKALLWQLLRGQLTTHNQAERSATELVQSAGNQTVPAGKTQAWTKFVFSIYTQTPITFGDSSKKYGGPPVVYVYGQLDNSQIIYDLDPDILSIPLLYDNLANPTKVLTEGIDYQILDSKLLFRTPVRLDGAPFTFYARNLVREAGFTTSRLGYALGVQLSDKVYSKVPFKHLWRLGTYGPNYLDMLNMLGACAKAPVTNLDEVVELFELNSGLAFIVTDRAAYVVPAEQSTALKIGQQLPAGTSLSNSLQVLHDKAPYVAENIPVVYRDRQVFKYGSELAKASSMVILKADIQGPQSAALKVFKDNLPVDIKVLIFTNTAVTAVNLTEANFSSSCQAGYSVTTPAVAISESQVFIKATSKVKYSSYGY